MSLKQIKKHIARLEELTRQGGGMLLLSINPEKDGYSISYSVEGNSILLHGFPSRVEAWEKCDEVIEKYRPDWSMIFLNEWDEIEDPELDRYLEKRKLKDVRRITFIDDITLED